MQKNQERSALIKKVIVPISALVVLTGMSFMVCASNVTKTLNVIDGQNITVLKTKKVYLFEALNEAGIEMGEEDRVVPGLSSEISTAMDVEVRRAININIVENGVEKTVVSSAETVGEMLLEQGNGLCDLDVVSPEATEPLSEGMVVNIDRAYRLIFENGCNAEVAYTRATTVADFLKERDIAIGEDEKLNIDIQTPITNGMRVEIIKMTQEEITDDQIIYYGIKAEYTSELAKGENRLIYAGTYGQKTVTYKVYYENGAEVRRELINENVYIQPVDEIREYGTAEVFVTASGESIKALKSIEVKATAYDLSYASCGKNPGDRGYGITASGMRAGVGVIAVDPRVIPLGTNLYVEAADGSWSYGYCVAGDTGGAIKGNRIDLFYNTASECRAFGVRQAKVYILG